MMRKLLLLILLMFLSIGCTKENNVKNIPQDLTVVVSAQEYANAPNDDVTINGLEIMGDSLKINFSSGGCNGSTWELQLIDSGEVLEKFPPQRNVRLSLKNDEVCKAYITKEISFNISSLQVDGNQVELHVLGYDKNILYKYE